MCRGHIIMKLFMFYMFVLVLIIIFHVILARKINPLHGTQRTYVDVPPAGK